MFWNENYATTSNVDDALNNNMRCFEISLNIISFEVEQC